MRGSSSSEFRCSINKTKGEGSSSGVQEKREKYLSETRKSMVLKIISRKTFQLKESLSSAILERWIFHSCNSS